MNKSVIGTVALLAFSAVALVGSFRSAAFHIDPLHAATPISTAPAAGPAPISTPPPGPVGAPAAAATPSQADRDTAALRTNPLQQGDTTRGDRVIHAPSDIGSSVSIVHAKPTGPLRPYQALPAGAAPAPTATSSPTPPPRL